MLDGIFGKTSVQWICLRRTERPYVRIQGGVEKDMQPRAQHPRDSHLHERGRMGQTEQIHYPTDEVAKRICSRCPPQADKTSDKQSVTVPMNGVIEIKAHHKQRLEIDGDVGPYKYGNIYPPVYGKAHTCVRTKVKRSERHFQCASYYREHEILYVAA